MSHHGLGEKTLDRKRAARELAVDCLDELKLVLEEYRGDELTRVWLNDALENVGKRIP